MRYSVITINYNNRDGLRRTIESVVQQKSTDKEFIVIDGGSTDGSTEVIRQYADQIDYWVSERDRGIYHAMNKGVVQAHSDYCIFMNSGDVFYDDTVLERITQTGANEDIVVGKVAIDEHDHIISPPPTGELTLYHLYWGAVPHQGTFIRTTLLHQHPYDETMKISADWKFFLQTLILDNCPVRYVDEFVARYDMNGVSADNPQLMRDEKDKVLESLFPPRLLADYVRMKQSECLTQQLTPQLRINYSIDKILYKIGKILLRLKTKNDHRI